MKRLQSNGNGVPARILLVEDHDVARSFASLVLTRAGHHVTAVRNAEDALEACAGLETHFDLLITDVALPDLDGCELATRVLAMHACLKVMVTSAYWRALSAPTLVGAEAFGYLEKPYTHPQLTAQVEQLLAA